MRGLNLNADEVINQRKRSPQREKTLSPKPSPRCREQMGLRSPSHTNVKLLKDDPAQINKELKFQNSQLKGKIQLLEQELAQKCSELEDFEKELMQIEKKFTEVEKGITGRDTKIGDLLKEVAVKNQRIERLEDETLKSQKTTQKLLQDKVGLQQKKQEFETLLEVERQKCAVLEEEKLKLKTQVENQAIQIGSLTEELGKLIGSPLKPGTTSPQQSASGNSMKKDSASTNTKEDLNSEVELLRNKLRVIEEENNGYAKQLEDMRNEVKLSNLELLKVQRESRDEKELLLSKVEEFSIVFESLVKNLFSSDTMKRTLSISITQLIEMCKEIKELQSLIDTHAYLEELVANNEVKKENASQDQSKEMLSKVETFFDLLYKEIKDALSSDRTPRPHQDREPAMRVLIEELKPLSKGWEVLELVIEKHAESLNHLAEIQLSNEINQQRLISQIKMLMEENQRENRACEFQEIDIEKLNEKERTIQELKERLNTVEEATAKFSTLMEEGLRRNFESSSKEAALTKLRTDAKNGRYGKILLGIFTKVAEKIEGDRATNEKSQNKLSQQVKTLSEDLQKANSEKAGMNENLQKVKKREAALQGVNQLQDAEINQLKKALVQVEEACNLFSRNVKDLFNQPSSEYGGKYSLNDRLARMKQISSRVSQIKELEKVFGFLKDSTKDAQSHQANNLGKERMTQTLSTHKSTSDLLSSQQNLLSESSKFQTPLNSARKNKLELDIETIESNETAIKDVDPRSSNRGSGFNKTVTFNFIQTPTGKQTTPRYVKNGGMLFPSAQTPK